MIELKRKLTRNEETPKYTKDPNVNKKFNGWSRKGIKQYNNLIKVVRVGRNAQVSKEMEIELKLKYSRICGKRSVKNSLINYSDPGDSDGEDSEAYDGFAGNLIVIYVEQTGAV